MPEDNNDNKNMPEQDVRPAPAPEVQSEQPSAPAPAQSDFAQQPGAVQQQPVQYMVMQQSLKGVGGWLIFWMIMFSLAAIGYIMMFFTSMLSLNNAVSILTLIFAPILAAGFIATTVFIAMQKKLAKKAAFITLGVSALYGVINSIVMFITVKNAANAYVSSSDSYGYRYSSSVSSSVDSTIPVLIGGILVTILVHALIALYFFMSKRVKETLVN